MRRRNIIIASSAAVAAAIASVVVLTLPGAKAGISPAVQAQPVTTTIQLSETGEVLEVSPADASPALTPQSAAVTALSAPADTAIPSDVTVLLGLCTRPIGNAADCQMSASACAGDTIIGGTVYADYQVLVYAYHYSECGDGDMSASCSAWEFVNANTGADIGGTAPLVNQYLTPSASLDSPGPAPTPTPTPTPPG